MQNIIHKQSHFSRVAYLLIAMALVLSYMSVLRVGHAGAVPFTQAYVRLDSLKALDTGVSGKACFRPTVTTVIKSIQVTFPVTNGTSYALAAAGGWTITTTNLDSTETAATNISSPATSVSGSNLNIDFGGAFLTPVITNVYCFKWSGASTLTVPSNGATETTPGTITTFSAIAESGPINSTTFSEPQTVTTTGDTVAVSATVPPSFSFSLNGTTDTFAANLAIASVNTSTGRIATVNTNAATGWIIWARDNPGGTCTKGGLYSTIANYCISSAGAANSAPALISTGVTNYGFAVTNRNTGSAGTCSLVNVASYNYDGITSAGFAGILSNSLYNPIASCDGSATGSTATFQQLVTITGATPAASDYADTIQLTAAGRF